MSEGESNCDHVGFMFPCVLSIVASVTATARPKKGYVGTSGVQHVRIVENQPIRLPRGCINSWSTHPT